MTTLLLSPGLRVLMTFLSCIANLNIKALFRNSSGQWDGSEMGTSNQMLSFQITQVFSNQQIADQLQLAPNTTHIFFWKMWAKDDLGISGGVRKAQNVPDYNRSYSGGERLWWGSEVTQRVRGWEKEPHLWELWAPSAHHLVRWGAGHFTPGALPRPQHFLSYNLRVCYLLSSLEKLKNKLRPSSKVACVIRENAIFSQKQGASIPTGRAVSLTSQMQRTTQGTQFDTQNILESELLGEQECCLKSRRRIPTSLQLSSVCFCLSFILSFSLIHTPFYNWLSSFIQCQVLGAEI